MSPSDEPQRPRRRRPALRSLGWLAAGLVLGGLIGVSLAPQGDDDDGGGGRGAKAAAAGRATDFTRPDPATSGDEVVDEGDVKIVYAKPADDDEAAMRELISESGALEELADSINEAYALPEDVVVKLGGDEDGPFYDPETGGIEYPWWFVVETHDLLEQGGYEQGEELDGGIVDATQFIATHELGHALVDKLQLPITAREEDAVDAFAVVTSVQLVDAGELAVAASDLFGYYEDFVNDEDDESVFFDSHSLDIQRFYTISCLVYGADTDRYEDVVDGLDIDEERLDECPAEYEQSSNGWNTLLEPYEQDDDAGSDEDDRE